MHKSKFYDAFVLNCRVDLHAIDATSARWRHWLISAQVRVLYHDSTMRIFESPLTSQDKWEESGLVVVQVRESAVINS